MLDRRPEPRRPQRVVRYHGSPPSRGPVDLAERRGHPRAAANSAIRAAARPAARAAVRSNTRNAVYLTILAGFAFALHVVFYRNGGYSWHFFADSAALLFGHHPPGTIAAGGLHIYANYPQFQFGPLTLLVAAAMRPFGTDGGWMVAAGLMTLAGLVVLHQVDGVAHAIRPDLRTRPRAVFVTMLLGGGSFVFSWELLAVHFGHLDDALALVFITGALVAVAYRRPVLAGLCVGLAADAKPWALVCAALLLAFTGADRRRAVLLAVVTVAVAWLPFFLADPHTFGAAKFVIGNVPASALHAMGVNDATTPAWDRYAQILVGCGLGVVAILRRRWVAVIALGIGARLLLDPSVYTYYTAGLALGLLLWDLTGYRRPMPLLSVLCLGTITLVVFVLRNPMVLGELRLWTVLTASVVMLLAPTRTGERRDSYVPDDAETITLPGWYRYPVADSTEHLAA